MSEPSKICPFCGSKNTEKYADFGTAIMVRQHYCRDCKSVFEWVKWGDDESQLDLPEFLKTPKKGGEGERR